MRKAREIKHYMTGKINSQNIAEAVLKFLHRCEDVVIKSFLEAGACGQNKSLHPFKLDDENGLLATSSKLDCVPASMVNAMGQCEGREKSESLRAYLLDDEIHYTKLARIGSVITKMKLGCQLRKAPKPMRKILKKRMPPCGFRVAS